MNKRVKNTWVRALRSGKYKQGRAYLHERNTYCCLGVLCEVAIKSKAKDAPTLTVGDRNYMKCTTYNAEMATLPEEVKAWAVIGNNTQTTLIEMNDKEKMSFEQIADWIEKNL